MLNEILKRIEMRLEAVGLEPAAASLRAGLSKDAIRNLQRNAKRSESAGMSTSTLIQLAPVLETSAAWLLEGVDCGPENVPASARRLWAAWTLAANAPPAVQDRIAHFAEYQVNTYEKPLETATNPVA